jgi:hypothetical protein
MYFATYLSCHTKLGRMSTEYLNDATQSSWEANIPLEENIVEPKHLRSRIIWNIIRD